MIKTYKYTDIYGHKMIMRVEVLKNGLYFYSTHDANDNELCYGGRVSKETFEKIFKKYLTNHTEYVIL